MFIIFRNNSYEYVESDYDFINHLKYEYSKYTVMSLYDDYGYIFINHLKHRFYSYKIFFYESGCNIDYEWFSKDNIRFYYSRCNNKIYYDNQPLQLINYNLLYTEQINEWDYICL